MVRVADHPDMPIANLRGGKQQQQHTDMNPLHSERPKLYAILAFLSAIGLIECLVKSFIFYVR